MVSIAADGILVERPVAARRGGWLLIAGMLASIAVILFSMAVGGDVERYADDVARAAGKSSEELTASEIARVAEHYPAHWVVYSLITLIPLGVFTLAIYELRGSLHAPRTRALLTWAWRAAVAMMVVWVSIHLLFLGLMAGPGNLPPLVGHFDALSEPADLATATCGMAAILCLACALRRAALAPRLALVVIVLTGLALSFGIGTYIVSGGEQSMEADIALIPALVLGIGLVLATRSPKA